MEIESQINAVMNQFPNLSIEENKDGIVMSGAISMNKSFNDIPIYDEYNLKICVSNDFPKTIPSVYDMNGKIPTEFSHFYDDGSFCLGARCELRSFLDRHPSLIEFINEIVMSYLYTASYFCLYGTFPFGERSHGTDGIREAYFERYGVTDENLLLYLLLLVVGEAPFRGHSLCPCGSGKHLRQCHGARVLDDIRSEYSDDYKFDAYTLLIDYYEKEKNKNGKDSSSKKQL